MSGRIVLLINAQASDTNTSKNNETLGYREVIAAKVFCFAENFCSGTGEDFFEELVAGWSSKPDREAGRLFRSDGR